MPEISELRDELLEVIDRLTPTEELDYWWQSFGDEMLDCMRDWDEELFNSEITHLQEKLKEDANMPRSKNFYENLAARLKTVPVGERLIIAGFLKEFLKSDNPRFNPNKFMEAIK